LPPLDKDEIKQTDALIILAVAWVGTPNNKTNKVGKVKLRDCFSKFFICKYHNTNNTNTNTQANTKQTQDPFNPNNNSNQASSEALNNKTNKVGKVKLRDCFSKFFICKYPCKSCYKSYSSASPNRYRWYQRTSKQ
jgi:hypothetical protein